MKESNGFVLFFSYKDVFSNFYYSPFIHKGIQFKWSEQAVMYEKAMLFGAKDVATAILKAQTAKECKQLGRSRRIPFKNEIWDAEKKRIYKEVLRSKFSNPKLKAALLNTKYDKFAEASPYDKIWGIGLSGDDPNATNPAEWLGQNLLCEILTELKAEMKND